jgi:hypothetical protein
VPLPPFKSPSLSQPHLLARLPAPTCRGPAPQGEEPQWETLVTLAEETLRAHGCGNATAAVAAKQRAERAVKIGAGVEDAVGESGGIARARLRPDVS